MRMLATALALMLWIGCTDDPEMASNVTTEGGAPTSRQQDAGSRDGSLPPKQVEDAARANRDDGDAGTEKPNPSTDGGTKPAMEAGAPATDGGPPRDPLCDGSTNTRLVFAGPSSTIPFPYWSENWWFRQPYGTLFLAIDGACHYYVSNGISQGILTGTLTSDEAKQLSSELGWDSLDTWSAYGTHHPIQCADGGFMALRKQGRAAVGCTCTCDATAPAGLDGALQDATKWMSRLQQQGSPLGGSVRAMAVSDPRTDVGAPEVTWPLSRAIASIPNLILPPKDGRLMTGPFALFDDAEDVAALKSLRSRTNDNMVCVIAIEGDARYALFVRDELPEAVAKTWLTIE